jgi:hypothetical protein
MRNFGILFVMVSTAISGIFAQTDVMAPKGRIVNIFMNASGKAAVCQKSGDKNTVTVLSAKMKVEKNWEVPGNVMFFENAGFNRYLAFADIGPLDSATGFQSIKLKFLNTGTGKAVSSRLSVKLDMPGKWANAKDNYCMAGKLCTVSGDKVKTDRISSVPVSQISPDLSWGASALVRETSRGEARVSIELENRKTSDMISVETYTIRPDIAPLLDFTADPRYIYYRSHTHPAVYDIKERRSISADNINYKQPKNFGYYLGGTRSFVFFDYYAITFINRKKFEVERTMPNPFGEEVAEIQYADKKRLYGALHKVREKGRDYTKLFALTVKSAEARNVALPINTKKVWFKKTRGHYLYLENKRLKYSSAEMK